MTTVKFIIAMLTAATAIPSAFAGERLGRDSGAAPHGTPVSAIVTGASAQRVGRDSVYATQIVQPRGVVMRSDIRYTTPGRA